MRLYGNDIDESTTVLEAGLDWTVAWGKQDFIGRDRLVGAAGERDDPGDGWPGDDRPRHRPARVSAGA
jgi:glycine cleavage system aminomethyltransferase T